MADTKPLRSCPACSAAIPTGALTCPACGTDAPTEIGTDADAMGRPLWLRIGALEARSAAIQGALGAGFEVRRLVGAGGFGEVWEVFDLRLQRPVAVKVLRPELAASPAFRERFAHEARAVAKLRHPGIVPIYHVGEAEGLVHFIMPLVEGVTLKAELEQAGRLEPEEAIRILAEASAALREAHRRGIVHRDLKPENVMLEGPERRVVLMDFGIAQSDESDARLTGAGLVLGSPEYMSPEQATGAQQLDGRSDIYSLGVVGYRMLAGKLPFHGETARELLAQHVLSPPEPLADFAPVPPGLSDAVMRCLAKRPEERWQSAGDLLAALDPDAAAHRSSGAPLTIPSGVPAAAPGPPAVRSRARRAVVVGTAIAVLAIAAGGWAYARWSRIRNWERAAIEVSTAYRTAIDSLRALADGFRRGTLAGARLLAAQESVQRGTEARIEAAFGPILDDLGAWPPALRENVDSLLRETWEVTLAGGALTPQTSGAAGCITGLGSEHLALQDSASGTNCWWGVASAPRVALPVEYALRFRVAPEPGAGAGVGLAWCLAATQCRVLFLWSRGRAEWASHSPGSGLRSRQLGARLPPLVGEHRLRVRGEMGRSRVWLDDALVLDRARGEPELFTRPDVVRLVVQNTGLDVLLPEGLQVVGARP